MSEVKVLVVDDEANICSLLEDALTSKGYTVRTCRDGECAIARAKQETFQVVFLDIKMPGMSGVEVLKRLRKQLPKAAFVMITGYAQSDLVDESLSSGAFVCLSKPFGIAQVLDVVDSFLPEKTPVGS
jgi:DNA-binding NtrC family response regulator